MEQQHKTIEITVNIQAKPSKVWEVFTNPILTRQLGGEYVTNWQVGGDFGFKMNGQMVTKGTITSITPHEYLEHTLTDPQGSILSKISYRLKAEDNGNTLLQGKEQFMHPVSKQEYEGGEQGWRDALGAVKRIAEED